MRATYEHTCPVPTDCCARADYSTSSPLTSGMRRAGAAVAAGVGALLWAFHAVATEPTVTALRPHGTEGGELEEGGSSVVDVKDFGAKGDGHTDDTASIQAAVDRAAAEGRTVFVSSGTCLIDAGMAGGRPGWAHVTDAGGVKLPSHTNLVLSTKATLKAIPHGGYGGNVLRVLGGHDITIQGTGRILGDRAGHDYANPRTPTAPDRTTHEWNAVISVRGGSDIAIRGVTIAESSGDGITIGAMAPGDLDTTRVRVVGCRIDGSRRNNVSVLGRTADVFITSNVITNAGFNDASDAPIRVAGVPPRAGVDVEGGYLSDGTSPRRIVIEGNSLHGNWGPAISSYNGNGVVIQGNLADSSVGYAYSKDVTIAGNTLQEGAQSDPGKQQPWDPGATYRKGDKVQAGKVALVSLRDENRGVQPEAGKGTWMAFAPPGIYGLGLATGIGTNSTSISGNTVSGFANGIDVRGAGLTVSGNTLSGQRDAGILVYEANFALIEGNQVTAVPVGVRLSQSAAGVAVSGNQITGATKAGILSHGREMAIRGNILRGALVGILILGGSATVFGNQVDMAGTETGAIGVRVSGEKTRSLIQANMVHDPPGVAIGVVGSEAVIIGNAVTGAKGTGPAISVDGAEGPKILDNLVTFARRDPGGVGISVVGSKVGTVTGNRIFSEAGQVLSVPIRTEAGRGHRVFNNLTPSELDDHGTPESGQGSPRR